MRMRKNIGMRAVVMGCAAALLTASALGESAAASGGAAPAPSSTTTAGTPAVTAPEIPKDFIPDGAIKDGVIDKDSPYRYDEKLATFWKAQVESAGKTPDAAGATKGSTDTKKPVLCYEKLGTKILRDGLGVAADKYLKAVSDLNTIAKDLSTLSQSGDSTSAGTPEEEAAQKRLSDANKQLPDARSNAKLAEDALDSARKVRDPLQTKLTAHATDGKPLDTNLVNQFKDADKVFNAASAAWTKARDERDAIQAEVDSATAALTAARKTASDVKKKALEAQKTKAESARNDAHTALRKAISDVQSRPLQSPSDFEAHLDDADWVKACTQFQDDAIAAGVLTKKNDKGEDAKAKDTWQWASDARNSDVLRKSPSTPSVLGTGSGYVETGGAPDRLTYNLFSALGADQKTTSTQMLLTLNLGQFFSDKKTFLEQPALVRNLFVRASVPLTATKDVPLAGPTTDATTKSNDVSRVSFVLGTSLYDSTDPRLFDNRACYEQAYLYNAMEQRLEGEKTSESQERAPVYVDVCNRVAANRNKLALRAGIGLLTKADDPTKADSSGKTDVEYLAGALVWAPTSWLYFNGLYQRLFLPAATPVHQFGGGVSTSFNVTNSLSDSGVNAWARIGLDVLVLGVYDDVNKKTDIEVRSQLTTRFKLVNTGILTFGIGPKVLGSQIQNPGLLASVGLTYDADSLIDSFMGTQGAATAPTK